jgi:potassium-transporting ATPase KdpC subunit
LTVEARTNDASIRSLLRPTLVSTALFILVTGLAYPLLTTGVAQVLFPSQAQGSLIEHDGKVIGSSLIGQQFTEARYFHPRPSVTTVTGGGKPEPYNAAQSAGTNYGATNRALVDDVNKRVERYREENDLPADAKVPVDAVTASSSGLDPHISIANAELQVPRVAEERGIPQGEVRRLVEENTDSRLFGFIGEPGVNVLELNLTLDTLEKR